MDERTNEIQQKISSAASKLLGNAMDNIVKDLPEDSKKEFFNLLIKIEEEGLDAVIEEYQESLERDIYEFTVQVATHHADAVLNHLYKKFPEGKTSDRIYYALKELSEKGIEGLCSGKSLEEIKFDLANISKAHFRSYVEEQTHIYSKTAGKKIYMSLKFKGRGSRSKNRYLHDATDLFANELAVQISDNIDAWINGQQNLAGAAGNIILYTAKNSIVQYTEKNGKKIAVELAKEASKLADKEIKNKTIRKATTSVINKFTGTDTKQGKEFAVEAVKELSKLAEKKIQNETARQVVTGGLNKLAKANTLTNVAGTVYDLGNAFKKLMNGEITKTEFLREIGEKGTGAVVSGVYATFGATLGTIVAGPLGGMVGGAIGSAVGYFANTLLYGSVLQAFEDAELSRKRYEAMHAFCEYYIEEMKRQRQEFEEKVAQFLSDRQQVIDTSLNQFEEAMRKKDFNSMSDALNNIAEEFGGKLQFKTFKEFDDFMSDPDSVFEL